VACGGRPWRGGSPPAFGGLRGGGRRRLVPTSSGMGRWREGRRTRAGRRWHAGRRRAPWDRGRVARAEHSTPTEQRTGADRPQRPLVLLRVAVPGGGGSARAFGHWLQLIDEEEPRWKTVLRDSPKGDFV
jgi:hypothetical protein